MIISENIELELKKPVTCEQIEKELKHRGMEVLRWAITDVQQNIFTIRISLYK